MASRRLLALRGLCAVAVLWCLGCGAAWPSPFTAADMAEVGTGEALVHYLAQPGATAAVCDWNAKGPHFRATTADDFADVTAGLLDGDVRPVRWQRCAMLMVESLPTEITSTFLDEMAHAYRTLLERDEVDSEPEARAKLEALHQSFLLRPPGTAPHAEVVEGDEVALRQALVDGALGPVALRYGRDLLRAIDLDRGLWNGRKLSVSTLDALEAEKNEKLLRRIARRVPDEKLRTEARRRIVRLHIATSRSPDVREHAEEVEAKVLATGHNAIDVSDNPPTGGWVDPERIDVKGVLVRQDVWRQTVTLLAFEGEQPTASVIPSLALRGALFVRVDGLAEPVTLCAPPDALDVTPCLLPKEIHPTVPVVYVDDEGLLHFVERLTSLDAMKLVYETPNLPLPFEVGGRQVLTLEWPLVFERPDSLIFTGPTEGRGPDLRVTVERRYSPRLLFEVQAPEGKYVGVVEASDTGSFLIASQGGPGTPGSRGTDGASGSSGMAGMSASCPSMPGGNGGNGSAGGNGTAGGPGGPGGPGGDVLVNVACATGECGSTASLAQRVIRSEGGPGGPGGEGGRGGTGGQGGPGGSGTSCRDAQGNSTFLSGGSAGMSGSSGSPGARGADGAPGSPGHLSIQVAH